MRRHASIDNYVIFSGVVIDTQSPENEEATAVMDFLREVPQGWAQSW
jgi:hypothetical protein